MVSTQHVSETNKVLSNAIGQNNSLWIFNFARLRHLAIKPTFIQDICDIVYVRNRPSATQIRAYTVPYFMYQKSKFCMGASLDINCIVFYRLL